MFADAFFRSSARISSLGCVSQITTEDPGSCAAAAKERCDRSRATSRSPAVAGRRCAQRVAERSSAASAGVRLGRAHGRVETSADGPATSVQRARSVDAYVGGAAARCELKFAL